MRIAGAGGAVGAKKPCLGIVNEAQEASPREVVVKYKVTGVNGDSAQGAPATLLMSDSEGALQLPVQIDARAGWHHGESIDSNPQEV